MTRRLLDVRTVTVDPVVPLGRLLRPHGHADLTALLGMHASDRLIPAYSGTTAIFQALRAVGIGRGDRLLVPAYNCGHEVEAVLRTGAKPVCYRVDAQLRPDLDDVRARLREPARAVLIIHYCGFPQPLSELRRLCDDAGALLIEDCAHALFSRSDRGTLGREGDIAFFSLRKTLPVIAGGVAAIRARVPAELPRGLPPPPALSVARRETFLAYKALARYSPGLRGWIRRSAALPVLGAHTACRAAQHVASWAGTPEHDVDSEDFDFPDPVLAWGMDRRSAQMLAGFDGPRIAERRRSNFRLIQDTLRELPAVRPLLPDPGPGVCPLQYPFEISATAERLERLWRRKVAALDWWSMFHPAVDWTRFPFERRLKTSTIALPIHQGLTTDHIVSMLTCVTDALQSDRHTVRGL